MTPGKIRKLIDESFIYSYYTTWADIQKRREEEVDKDPAEHKIAEMLSNSVPIDPETVSDEFNKLLSKFDIDNVKVDDVDIDYEGNITITFVSGNDEMTVIFCWDEDDGAIALIDDGDEDTDYTMVDFDAMNPALIKTPFGTYVDLANARWINKSLMVAILTAGDFELEDSDGDALISSKDFDGQKNFDVLYQEISNDDVDAYMFDSGEGLISEAKKRVIRGGKAVKLAIVRKKRRKRVTGKQKAALKRAGRKRKMKKSSIKRKLKKSLKLRKRLGIKKKSLGKFRKVAGTADRKR